MTTLMKIKRFIIEYVNKKDNKGQLPFWVIDELNALSINIKPFIELLTTLDNSYDSVSSDKLVEIIDTERALFKGFDLRERLIISQTFSIDIPSDLLGKEMFMFDNKKSIDSNDDIKTINLSSI